MTRQDLVTALIQEAKISENAIAAYDDENYAKVVAFGKWAWIHPFGFGKKFSHKVNLELNEATDFEPVIVGLQRRLNVDIAVPDQTSPLPADMILFGVDGSKNKISVPDSEFE